MMIAVSVVTLINRERRRQRLSLLLLFVGLGGLAAGLRHDRAMSGIGVLTPSAFAAIDEGEPLFTQPEAMGHHSTRPPLARVLSRATNAEPTHDFGHANVPAELEEPASGPFLPAVAPLPELDLPSTLPPAAAAFGHGPDGLPTLSGGPRDIQLPDGRLQRPAIPEPATWVMMIVGYGIAGLAISRGKRRPSG